MGRRGPIGDPMRSKASQTTTRNIGRAVPASGETAVGGPEDELS